MLILLLAISSEVLSNVAGYFMKWNEVNSLVGSYECIPAYYPIDYNLTIPGRLNYKLSGEVGPSIITNYAIPIHDGLIGGWAAYPLDFPPGVKTFQLSRKGLPCVQLRY